jgi:hypothetical protein
VKVVTQSRVVNEAGIDIYDALQLRGSEFGPDMMHEIRDSTVDRRAIKK